MGDIGSALSSGLSNVGSAFGTDLSSLFSTPADAATASSPASLGAQAAISPPAAGSPDAQAADAGGVQSSDQTSPQQQGQPRQQGQGQNQQQYAPQSAVKALQKALETLIKQQAQQGQVNKGQWTPTTAIGEQGPARGQPAPQAVPSALEALQAQLGGNLPTPDQFAGGEQDQFGGLPTPNQIGAPRLATVNPGYGGIGADVNADPNPNIASMSAPGAQPPPSPSPVGDPGEARIPPGAADQRTVPAGGDVTVHAQPHTGAGQTGAAPSDTGGDTAQTTEGTRPQTGGPPPPRIPPSLAGPGGTSAMLPLLALAAIALGATAAAGGFGRHGRHGRGGRGGFGGYHHPGGRGHWPYHHPQQGWQFHDFHHGGQWRPMDPRHMQQLPWFRNPRNWWTAGRGTPSPYPPGWELLLAGLLGDKALGGLGGGQQGQQGGGQQGVYPPGMHRGVEPSATTTPDGTTASGAIPGVSAQMVDNYARQYAAQIGMDPNVVSRVLATESAFGQNTIGDIENGRQTSFGAWQLHFAPDGKALGDQYMHDTGWRPGDPAHWQDETRYVLDHVKKNGWGDYLTTMRRLGMGTWSGVNPQRAIGDRIPQPSGTQTGGGVYAPSPVG